jgi:hypothetical protein
VSVFSISLASCENINQSCGPRRTNLRVPAGSSRLAIRIQPKNPQQGYSYNFGFGWRADSGGVAAVAALAATGDSAAQARLADRQRADSIDRATPGTPELTRDDFSVVGARAVALRAVPDSLILTPGEASTLNRLLLLVVDSQGVPLGRTRWVRWQYQAGGAIEFTPPDRIVARQPGRSVVRFELAEEAQALLGRPLTVEVPIVAAYAPDPHAPSFAGLVVDVDSQTPLTCARVALEDSAQNVVARDHTTRLGTFVLSAPRPGTYRVRLDMHGWAPTYGPNVVALADEVKESRYAVRFSEPLLMGGVGPDESDFEHASPSAVVAPPIAAPPRGSSAPKALAAPTIRAVTFGGSSRPIMNIAGSAPAGTTWVQFLVDSTGLVDSTSTIFPPDTDDATVASVNIVLPRVRFSRARKAGVPTCERVQLQVNVNGGSR